MKVLLTENVPGTGERGAVVEVAPGHAQNFLIPKGVAVPATEEAVQAWRLADEKRRREAEAELRKVEEKVAEIDGAEVEIRVSINEQGELYGAVTAAQIIEALARDGFTGIDQKQVRITAPISEIGEHKVILEYPHGLEAEVTVRIAEQTA